MFVQVLFRFEFFLDLHTSVIFLPFYFFCQELMLFLYNSFLRQRALMMRSRPSAAFNSFLQLAVFQFSVIFVQRSYMYLFVYKPANQSHVFRPDGSDSYFSFTTIFCFH